MFEDALRYPLEGEEASEALLIGGAIGAVSGVLSSIIMVVAIFTLGIGLIFLPIAFVPLLFHMGYYVSVLESTIDGSDEPPAFENYERLGKDGIIASIVTILYFLPSTIVTLAAVVIGVVIGGNAGLGLAAMGLLFGSLLALVASYLFPASLANYAVNRSIGAAFATDDVFAAVRSRDYAVAWLIAAGIVVIGAIAATIVSVVPLIGAFLAPAVQFFFAVAAYRAISLGYGRTSGAGLSADESPAVGATPGAE